MPCPLCGDKGLTIRAEGPFAIARACECVARCQHCNGDGYVYERDERGYRFAKPCVCLRDTKRITFFNGAQIPALYADRTFESFEIDTSQKKIQSAWGHTNHFCLNFDKNQQGLLLYGNSGTGKTHLMVAAIRRLVLERARPIRFVEFVHLLSDMKASFGDRSRGQDLITPLVEVPVLAIDELGKGRGTDWEMSVLDELISKRYNTERTTLFTTNYDPTKTEGQDALVTHVGQRILSRLKEMCRWVEVNGADYREKLSPSIQIRSGNAISTKPAPQASPAERLDRRDGAHGVSNKPLHR